MRKMNNRILIVDDDIRQAKGMKKVLDMAGYEKFIATDTNSALEIYNKIIPFAVISDVNLKKESGIELIIQIKKYNPEVKGIIISGQECDVPEGIAFYPKAVDFEELMKQLKEESG